VSRARFKNRLERFLPQMDGFELEFAISHANQFWDFAPGSAFKFDEVKTCIWRIAI
jgi:hypothetical protein